LLVDPEQAELDVQDLPFTPTKSPDGPASQSFGSSSLTASREPRTMSEIEAEAIRIAIDGNAGNLVRAARELRIGRATLYRKLKKYGIPTRTQKRQLAR
jgi:DNA-binding NtrC family response regulator